MNGGGLLTQHVRGKLPVKDVFARHVGGAGEGWDGKGAVGVGQVAGADDLCLGEHLEHVLGIEVAGDAGMGGGEAGLVGGQGHAQTVLHELERALEDILAVVQEVLGLVGKGEGV